MGSKMAWLLPRIDHALNPLQPATYFLSRTPMAASCGDQLWPTALAKTNPPNSSSDMMYIGAAVSRTWRSFSINRASDVSVMDADSVCCGGRAVGATGVGGSGMSAPGSSPLPASRRCGAIDVPQEQLLPADLRQLQAAIFGSVFFFFFFFFFFL